MSVLIPIPKKGNAKGCSNYHNIALISHASRLCSKSFKLVFNRTWTGKLQTYKLDLEKAEEPESKLPTSLDHQKNKRIQKKYLFLLYWFCQSLWLCRSQQTGKFLKRWEYQTTWPASWEICMQVRKQQLELDMEQQTGSKSGKEYVKAVYCHSAYLTYMQSTSCKMLGWIMHKLEKYQ